MTAPALPAAGPGGATLLLKAAGAPAAPAWQPGQRAEAVVVRRLAAAEYLLRVDGALYAADLPARTTPGARLPLLFLGGQGAPRFLLLPSGASAPASPQFSAAARLLGSLLSGSAPAALGAAQPLLAAPSTAARPIALALQQMVQGSGLSYESHVQAWAQGQRPLAALLAEPQGRLSPAVLAPGAAASSASSAAPPGVPAAPAPAPAAAGIPSATALAEAAQAPALPQPLVPLVQQQLAYLAQGTVAWQGVLWPGQPMEWRLQVEDEAHAGATPGAAAERAWSSTLTLELPRLGPVQARLRLCGHGVRVHLLSPHGALRLGAAQAELARGIADAGLTLEAFAVEAGETP